MDVKTTAVLPSQWDYVINLVRNSGKFSQAHSFFVNLIDRIVIYPRRCGVPQPRPASRRLCPALCWVVRDVFGLSDPDFFSVVALIFSGVSPDLLFIALVVVLYVLLAGVVHPLVAGDATSALHPALR